MSDNSFNNTVESLFKGMDNFITTKTVIGDAVRFEDGTIVLPLVDVSFGVAAGAGKPPLFQVFLYNHRSYISRNHLDPFFPDFLSKHAACMPRDFSHVDSNKPYWDS